VSRPESRPDDRRSVFAAIFESDGLPLLRRPVEGGNGVVQELREMVILPADVKDVERRIFHRL
jgi:hypothetical protein